ncbi:outer membrane protein [Bartonella gabonensis]|uniref:outer membrane protein n=1 Tax=Bartonella gabonensis TaxID=2699889 RepID=UPI00158C6D8C|nr:outer membrane protein [Bartonella gabonensis]
MNTKCLIALSLFTFITASTAQAADTVVFQPSKPNVSAPSSLSSQITPVNVSKPFSWTGFYFGGQVGYISNNNTLNYMPEATRGKWAWVNRDLSPELSGFEGGFYAGANLDLGDDLVVGIDTDMVWLGKENTQTDNRRKILDKLDSINATLQAAGVPIIEPSNSQNEMLAHHNDIVVTSVTLKEKWAGALRARLGFASHRLMPYIAGGITYTQMQYILSLLAKSQEDSTVFASSDVFDKTKTMIGYTAGAGFDFAITESMIMRTEYRYSEFMKQKFLNDELEINAKMHDFRLGIAYKF